jgi:alkylhydroperoxidase/carboxymuconolactone decarboxylase family protein YurZ
MSKNYKDITKRVSGQLAKFRTDMPDVMKGFGGMAQAATRDGALDKKTKELIATSMAASRHGKPRVTRHRSTSCSRSASCVR